MMKVGQPNGAHESSGLFSHQEPNLLAHRYAPFHQLSSNYQLQLENLERPYREQKHGHPALGPHSVIQAAPLPYSSHSTASLPLHMVPDQDSARLHHKRLRNRIAASKCRKRKLERMKELKAEREEKASVLGERDAELAALRAAVRRLHHQLALSQSTPESL